MKKLIVILVFIMTSFTAFSQARWTGEIPDIKAVKDFDIPAYLKLIGETTADAFRLNKIGLEAYTRGDLLRAARLWWCSINKDSHYAWSHYNFACVMALIAEATGVDPSDVHGPDSITEEYLAAKPFFEAAFYYLKKAVILDKTIFNKMRTDEDLKIIRMMEEYDFMLLYPKNDPEALLSLCGEFYGSNRGVYPDGGSVTFGERTVALTVVTIDYDNPGNSATTVYRGTYSVQDEKIILNINSPEYKTLYGDIKIRKDEFGFITGLSLRVDGRFFSLEPDYSA